jgi:sulfonate transport system substrate-binding protein
MRRAQTDAWAARSRRAAGLIVAAALAAGTIGPAHSDPVRLRIGYDTIPLHIVPVIFRMPEFLQHKDTAYTVEFFRFRGSPLQVQALAANQIDIAALAFSTLATSIATARLPIKAIADLAQDGPWYSQVFAVKEESPIRSTRDLKGRTIGVNAVGGATDVAVRLAIIQAGLVPDKDVRIIEANLGAMPALVRSGKIDVGTFNAPTWAVAERQGGFRVLFRQADTLGDQQFLLYAAREDFIEKNRKALVAYFADYLRGLRAALEPKNRERVLKVISELAEAPVENFAAWALLAGKDYFHAPDGRVNVPALQRNIDTLHQFGLLKQTLDIAPHVDNSLVDAAGKAL